MRKNIFMTVLNGKPALINGCGRVILSDIKVGLEYLGKNYTFPCAYAEGEWQQQGDEKAGLVYCKNAKIEYRQEGYGIALRTSYTHVEAAVQTAKRFFNLKGLWHCGFQRGIYNNTISSYGFKVNEMQSSVRSVRFTEGQQIYGCENLSMRDEQGNDIVFGYITFENYFPLLQAGSDGRMHAWAQMEDRPVAQNDTLQADWLYIGVCDDIRYGLMDYAQITARCMNSRGGKAGVPWGFCHWYYYADNINPNELRANLATLAENSHRLPAGYFNIDDGWFKEWGNWTENETFACGMKTLADEIRAAGYLPGIWLAPFGVHEGDKLAEQHPDWFVRTWEDPSSDKPGKWGTNHMLDMSHPEVKQFTHDVFHKLSHEWGYRHIKIDIITCTLAAGKYSDPTYNALKNYREGLRIMREAVTEDTYILGCTAPMGPSIGYVDGMRTSRDVFGDWDCLVQLYNQNLKRYHYHGVWFNNDPDCLLTRTANEEDDYCHFLTFRTDAENRTFATAMMATGGAMLMSDKMPLLKEYQLELLSKMFPTNTRAAIPLDLMESDTPGLLDLGRRGNTHIYALINWMEAPRQMKLDIGCGHVFEFWAQQYLGHKQGVCSFEVEPHGARILFVTDDAPIAAIGVDDCLCPTVRQRYENGVLTGSFVKKGENMFVLSAQPITKAEGCTCTCICSQTGLYKLTQTGEDLNFAVQ